MSRRAHRSAVICVLLAVTVSAKADEQTDRLIREVNAKLTSLRSMTGTIALTGLRGGKTVAASGPFRLMKPNIALVQTKGEMASTLSSDGKDMVVLVASGFYKKEPVDAKGHGLYFSWALQVPMFFTPSEVLGIFKGWKSAYGGKHKLSAGECDKVVFTDPKDSNYHTTLFVSPDKVPVRFEMESTDQGVRMTSEMSNIKLNPPLATADFAYKLPATAKLYETPKYEDAFLKIGIVAEKFDLAGLNQDHVRFDEVAQGKKAILVNFWYSDSDPCRQAHVNLQKIYNEYKDKGLEVVAINSIDSKETVSTYLDKKRLTFKFGLTGKAAGTANDISQKYGVLVYPTNYLLDESGKVLWRWVGYEEAGMRDALTKAGFK